LGVGADWAKTGAFLNWTFLEGISGSWIGTVHNFTLHEKNALG
jgi:hypothetical protein